MKCDCQCHPVENSGFRKQYKPGDKRKLTDEEKQKYSIPENPFY